MAVETVGSESSNLAHKKKSRMSLHQEFYIKPKSGSDG